MKAPLILVASKRMDKNKKRKESSVIRMGKIARETLGLIHDKSVELWPDGDIYERTNRSRVLSINEAYKEDLKELKAKIDAGEMTIEDYAKVGFVTAATFSYLCRNNEMKDKIWIADKLTDIVIGSDPEFILLDNDRHEIYPSIPHQAALGSDGNLVEIRAHPAVTSAEHVKNMKDVFKRSPNVKSIQDVNWEAGCYISCKSSDGGRDRLIPVGGHIHIGTPAKLAALFETDTSSYSYIKVVSLSVLKKILDEYVGIPLMFVEGIKNSSGRRSCYGKLSDVRVDHGRLEYRTPGGDWLAHPKLAEAVLDATKAVAHSFFKLLEENNNSLDFIIDKAIYNSIVQNRRSAVDTLFGVNSNVDWSKDSKIATEFGATMPSKTLGGILELANPKPDKALLQSIYSQYKQLPVYSEYEKNVELFNEIVQLPAKALASIDRSLKPAWLEGADFII